MKTIYCTSICLVNVIVTFKQNDLADDLFRLSIFDFLIFQNAIMYLCLFAKE